MGSLSFCSSQSTFTLFDSYDPMLDASPIFPAEVFQLIIEELLSDSESSQLDRIRALVACSLSCTALASLSRPYIFQSVKFGAYVDHLGPIKPDGFARFLKENPHFGVYMQRVHYVIGKADVPSVEQVST